MLSFHEDSMSLSKFDFKGEYLEKIQALVYNLVEDVVEVSHQNVVIWILVVKT